MRKIMVALLLLFTLSMAGGCTRGSARAVGAALFITGAVLNTAAEIEHARHHRHHHRYHYNCDCY